MTSGPRATLSEARLRWLVRLRWLAMAGVLFATGVAALGVLPSARTGVLLAAVAAGVAYNLYFLWELRHGRSEAHPPLRQAIPDTAALTIVLWASGGIHNPFVNLYALHVILAGILAGPGAALVNGGASLCGLGVLVFADFGIIGTPPLWDPPAPWGFIAGATAVVITLGSAVYFVLNILQELRETQRRAQMRAQMLELTLDRIDAGLELLDDEGKPLWRNQKAQLIDDDVRAGLGAEDSDLTRRFSLETAEGERIYERVAFPIGARVMNLFLDRTRQVIAERQMLLTERLASLGRTVQGVAHELNTPLGSVQTLAADVRAALAALPEGSIDPALAEDLSESCELIVEEVRRCRRITHALLARGEAVRPTNARTLSLGQAVERAQAVVLANRSGMVALSLELPPEADLPVPADPLIQVMVNLLQNAIDAVADVSDPRVDVAGRLLEDGGLCIEVRDNGPGLDPSVQGRIFEPFNTSKPPGEGTGLGLYTAYVLVRELGGEIRIENRDERGVLATVKLPQAGGPAALSEAQ